MASLGELREATALLLQAVELAEEQEHPEWVAHALVPLGEAYRAQHQTRRARQAFSRAAELGDRIGARLWAQLGRAGLGITGVLAGKLADSEMVLQSALSASDGLQYPRARTMLGLGMLELRRGNPRLAEEWACQSIEIAAAAPYTDLLLESQVLRGRALLALERGADARAVLMQVEARARDIGARPLLAQARQALSE
jgi:hypothetical protein